MSEQQQTDPANSKMNPPAPLSTGEELLGGANIRGEVAGCPTGLDSPPPAAAESKPSDQHGHQFKPEVEELKGSRITGRAR